MRWFPDLYSFPSRVYRARSVLYTSARVVYTFASAPRSYGPGVYTFFVFVYRVQSIVYTKGRKLYTAALGERWGRAHLYKMETKLYTKFAVKAGKEPHRLPREGMESSPTTGEPRRTVRKPVSWSARPSGDGTRRGFRGRRSGGRTGWRCRRAALFHRPCRDPARPRGRQPAAGDARSGVYAHPNARVVLPPPQLLNRLQS